jgi:hypothetical protein
MTTLVALCLLSLLTGVDTEVAGFIVRPFDGLVALALPFALLGSSPPSGTHRRLYFAAGIFTLLPFFYVHVVSALSLGTGNALRESLQIAVMLSFAVAVASSIDRLDVVWFGRCMIAGLFCIMTINVGYHLGQGIWSGWKHLDEPKMTFTLLPVALAVTLLLRGSRPGLPFYLLWLALSFVVVLSGERKAMVSFALVTTLLALRGPGRMNLLGGLLVVVAVAGFLYGLADDYTRRQVSSVFSPFEAADYYVDEHGKLVPLSFSNVQRLFAAEQSWRYFQANPILGIGSNGYEAAVQEEFGTLPEYLLIGVHGEFQRVAVENGIVGLATYFAVWAISAWRTAIAIRSLRASGDIRAMNWLLACAMFFVAALIQCGLEASGTRAFAMLVLVALLPDVLSNHMQKPCLKQWADRQASRPGSEPRLQVSG